MLEWRTLVDENIYAHDPDNGCGIACAVLLNVRAALATLAAQS